MFQMSEAAHTGGLSTLPWYSNNNNPGSSDYTERLVQFSTLTVNNQGEVKVTMTDPNIMRINTPKVDVKNGGDVNLLSYYLYFNGSELVIEKGGMIQGKKITLVIINK